ncbi:hypothetical protein [Fulvivirga ligni]|uniref:hypothetical protein n=1 Tax=Fulvivirga ligni TaxID=2904246 RepID=UPI001F19687F|nr:hypothetical protein [Fulvivirga ligni]UII23923.1 hypothetical protein LVD16_11910 [Fulvivirga ligni]
MKKLFPIFIISILFAGCNGQYDKVPLEQFAGKWSLKGRSMFEGMEITITESEGALTGTITKLNDNKYIQMFAEEGDVWVSEISRSSNYKFKFTEKKIARELFGLYGLSSSTELSAIFIDKDTIGLSKDGKDPLKSSIQYIRIK